jgi:hypothetical protein
MLLQKMQSQGTLTTSIPAKKFPFAHLKKQMIPKPAFDMSYHVTVLGKYSKGLPKRVPSAIDRSSVSTLKWANDTRQYDPKYYKSH